jgi:Ankyrin repeats (3 copies)
LTAFAPVQRVYHFESSSLCFIEKTFLAPLVPFIILEKRHSVPNMGWKKFFSSPQTARNASGSLGPLAEETFLKGNDNDITDWVKRHPESCQTKLKVAKLGDLSPLTVVCRNKRLRLETIQAVHLAYPKAIVEDPSLHHALANQATLDIIQYLVTQHPESIFSRKNGRLPLHTACANLASIDVVEYVYRCYPEAIQIPDFNEHKLPLHLAVTQPGASSLAVVQFLIEKYPDGLKTPDYELRETKKNSRGYHVHKADYTARVARKNHWRTDCGLPFHLACCGYHQHQPPNHAAASSSSLPMLRALYKGYPNAIITKNKNGFLPIHVAAKSGAPLSTISYLSTLCPESIMEFTFDYDNPILLACHRWDAKFEIVQFLLSQHSSVSGAPPPTAWFVEYLEEASGSGAPPHIVSFLRSVVQASRMGYSCVRTFE